MAFDVASRGIKDTASFQLPLFGFLQLMDSSTVNMGQS